MIEEIRYTGNGGRRKARVYRGWLSNVVGEGPFGWVVEMHATDVPGKGWARATVTARTMTKAQGIARAWVAGR